MSRTESAGRGLRPSPAAGRGSSPLRDPVLWAFFVVLAAVNALYALTRHAQYLTAGYDLGIFDQAVRAYSRFQAPIVTLKGDDFLIWGDHFHPIVAAWAPLYWVWDDVRVLLIGQAVVVALAVFPVHRFVARRMGAPWSYLAVAGVMLGWAIQCMVDFDVHEIAFAVPLLAWAIDALDRRSDRGLWLAAALLLLVREDMGVIVAILGAIRWARAPRRWVGAAMVGAGLAVFVLVTGVVIPAFSPDGYGYWDYSQLGDGPSGAVLGALRHPLHALSLLVTPTVKLGTLLGLLAPLAFLSLGSPYALLAVPILVSRFLSDRELVWWAGFHYDAPVWIILALAAVDALGRRPLRAARWLPRAFAVFVVGIAVVGTVAVPYVGQVRFPLHRLLTGEAFAVPEWAADRAAVRAQIPADTCVAADDRIAGHLTHTNRVTVPGVSQHRQDFVVLDLDEPYPATTPVNWSTAESLAVAEAQGFRQVYRAGSVVLLRAPDYAGPTADCAP
jgi:uncharacterized membrane protein